MVEDDEVYFHILNDYRHGRLNANEAAQEMLDTMRARNQPLTIQVSKDVRPVFDALGELIRRREPSP